MNEKGRQRLALLGFFRWFWPISLPDCCGCNNGLVIEMKSETIKRVI